MFWRKAAQRQHGSPPTAAQRRVPEDALRERLMGLGGFHRTGRGQYWVSRDDVLSLIEELAQ